MKNKFAIYSACIGGYDNICQPLVVDERFDYFLFTNEAREENVGVWHVRKIDYTNSDMTRIARYVKTHPEELLSEYDATLWMDMNLQIADSYIYERFIDLYNSNTQIASIQHPERDCIYVEAYTMANWRFEHDYIAFEWCHKIYKDGYPFHRGMYETNILFRRKSEIMYRVNHAWWDCIDHHSKRDQFSCNYVLWKLGVDEVFFFPLGEHSQNTKHVNFAWHSEVSTRKLVSMGYWETLRYRTRNLYPNYTLNLWLSLCKFPVPQFVLSSWGILMGLPIFAWRKFKHRILHIPN